jgi:tetratricopeptide (TPR) repeat protein
MSEHKHTEVVEKDVLHEVQGFWNKNGKALSIAVAVVVIAVVGFYAYTEYVAKPKEEKAAEAIAKAQQYFLADSSRKVLDGDGFNKGVLYIIKTYGGTKTANLAHYYAGISYLKLGEFDKAVEHLKDFKTDALQVQMAAYGALGDAYAELNKKSEAVEFYQKAGTTFEKDEFGSSEYLFRAALLSETIGKQKEALEIYKTIKAKYPKTDKGYQADKYIYRLSIEKNDLSIN